MFKTFASVAAVAAIGFLAGEAEAKASKKDAAAYPLFDQAMTLAGGDLFWKSYGVRTPDDYILRLFRIQGISRREPLPNAGTKGPILLLHGITADSLTWFNRSDANNFAIGKLLAMQGYDVWFGNWRGTPYSRSHKTLLDIDGADEEAYWDFDNTTIADNDLRAMIKLVKSKSGTCQKITLMAHSYGCQVALNGLSGTRQDRADNYI